MVDEARRTIGGCVSTETLLPTVVNRPVENWVCDFAQPGWRIQRRARWCPSVRVLTFPRCETRTEKQPAKVLSEDELNEALAAPLLSQRPSSSQQHRRGSTIPSSNTSSSRHPSHHQPDDGEEEEREDNPVQQDGDGAAGDPMGGFGTLETSSQHQHDNYHRHHGCSSSVIAGGDPRLLLPSWPFAARVAVLRLLRLTALADKLPLPLALVVTNGKMVAVSVGVAYLIFVVLWLPFYLLSYAVGEAGIYVGSILFTFFVGRSIIRLIAFPGASQKVTAEIETEFSKYSVRMMTHACECLAEIASTIAATSPQPEGESGGPQNTLTPPRRHHHHHHHPGLYDMPVLWRRARTYRDRVLGVYYEVLLHLYGQQPQHNSTHPSLGNSFPGATSPDVTAFGNNRLLSTDDIGDLSGLTPQARDDGRELLRQLGVVLALVRDLEGLAQPVLEAGLGPKTPNPLTAEAGAVASRLLEAARELRDFSASLRRVPPPASRRTNHNGGPAGESDDEGDNNDDDEEDVTVDAVRRRFEETSHMDAVKAGLASIIPMLDPPPHTSIFGFDVLRGCVLSRYRGARQLWVPRPHGGRMDVLHFPARSTAKGASGVSDSDSIRASSSNRKAVLYCNPNAGLIEVSVGMGFTGGNVPSAESDPSANSNGNGGSCWTDYYTNQGLDVYVFNYAGYGRSHGTTLCVSGAKAGDRDYRPGFSARLVRIIKSTFLTFTPRPDTLRSDGIAMALHLINNVGIEQLVIHGESIGGVAASAAGRYLSSLPSVRDKVSLLICDRTFCNLEAVAQRLVGGWSGYAIKALAPLWGTDVTGDFVATSVPKVVAADAADAIIDDAASLKSGVSLWREIRRGAARSTNDIGWMSDPPLQYRMADWENVCVNDSKYVAGSSLLWTKVPVWPSDKRISLEEAFHFAACCTRIGKMAKGSRSLSVLPDTEAGIEYDDRTGAVPSSDLLFEAWKALACCDGLAGGPLGVAVKRGFDATVSWLCSTVVYGSQGVATRAASRCQASNASLDVIDQDFDHRPPDFESDESEEKIHPKPLPEVVRSLTYFLETGDESLRPLSHEFQFVQGMLHYIQARITAEVSNSQRVEHQYVDSEIGHFMNLHCGHNNAFSKEEQEQLKFLVEKALSRRQAQSTRVLRGPESAQISIV